MLFWWSLIMICSTNACKILIRSVKHHLTYVNSSLFEQNGPHFADDAFNCISLNEKFCILIWISLKFVHKGLIDKNTALATSHHLNQRDPIHGRIYVALWGNELTSSHISYHLYFSGLFILCYSVTKTQHRMSKPLKFQWYKICVTCLLY